MTNIAQRLLRCRPHQTLQVQRQMTNLLLILIADLQMAQPVGSDAFRFIRLFELCESNVLGETQERGPVPYQGAKHHRSLVLQESNSQAKLDLSSLDALRTAFNLFI